MSSHHSQRCTNLHHDQVNAGKARREQRRWDRLQNFLGMREQLHSEYNCVLSFAFLCFAYTMLAIPFYLMHVLYSLGITPTW